MRAFHLAALALAVSRITLGLIDALAVCRLSASQIAEVFQCAVPLTLLLNTDLSLPWKADSSSSAE